MIEINEEVVLITTTDHLVFHTLTDGDTLVFDRLEISPVKAATLAWLINHPAGTELKVKIKLKS